MQKKNILPVVSAILIVGVGVFAAIHAFALDYYELVRGLDPNPLTSQVENCKIRKQYYKQNIANTKAKGLSLHLSKKEIKNELEAIKSARDTACLQTGDPAVLKEVCKELKKGFGKEVARIKSDEGLTPAEAKALIDEAKKLRDDVCKKAGAAKKK